MSSAVVVKEFPLEEEYKKQKNITPEDIRKLRQWLDTQPHLPGDFITDLDLILAFHCCNCSTEVTKQVLDLNYTLRTLFSGLFKDRTVDDKVLRSCDAVAPLVLGIRSFEGDAVLYARLVDLDVKLFNFQDIIRTVIMVADLWQYKQGTWLGAVVIIDMAGATVGHLARVDLQTVQQFLYFVQEAVFLKLKNIHFLNAPGFMDKVMMLIRPFLKKSFVELINIHQVGSKDIEKILPIEGLPKEAGGQGKDCVQQKEDVKAMLKANAEFFATENKKRVVEGLRPGKPKTISDIFEGVEGSFKKLDID